MKPGLIVVAAFLCTFCHFTEAQMFPVTPLSTPINTTTCGTTKLCVFSEPNCDPAGTSSCFFTSIQNNKDIFTVEMSGTTSGYVAAGFTSNVSPFSIIGNPVLVCGNNKSSVFFQTASQSGSTLKPNLPPNLNNLTVQGSTNNQNLTQCVITVNLTSFAIFQTNVQLLFNLTIFNGTTNGTDLGPAATVAKSNRTLTLPISTSNGAQDNTLNITRNGCNSTKLCVSSGSSCDPAGTSSCFFSSFQVKNQMFYIELSGTTSGYVALGLTNQNTTYVFVCGNNNNNNSFFFQTATQNNTNLNSVNLTTVFNSKGVVAQNLIQCILNTSTTFNISPKASDTMYQVTIMNGTTNGTQLGPLSIRFDSGKELDLSSPSTPSASTPSPSTPSSSAISNLCSKVMAVLLSALILCH